jgi:hypothetical protein
MKTLLSVQDNRLASRLGRMNLGRTPSNSSSSAGPSSPVSDRRPGRRRSYERTRPGNRPPTAPMSPSSGTTFSDRPPSVPEAPSSPLTSATAGSARSGVSDVIREHWCKEVFKVNKTSTPLRTVEFRSRCCGDPQPDVKHEIKKHGFEEVLKMQVENFTSFRVCG